MVRPGKRFIPSQVKPNDTSFSIDFKDIAGNEGVSKDQTVIDNTIQIDTKTPTLTMVNLSSSNTDDTFAKKDDLVTLSFISSENLQKGS